MLLRHTECAYCTGLPLARHELFELTRRPNGRFGVLFRDIYTVCNPVTHSGGQTVLWC